jgi:hypothetical protein
MKEWLINLDIEKELANILIFLKKDTVEVNPGVANIKKEQYLSALFEFE